MRHCLAHIYACIWNFFDPKPFVTPPTHFPRNHRHFPPLCAHKGCNIPSLFSHAVHLGDWSIRFLAKGTPRILSVADAQSWKFVSPIEPASIFQPPALIAQERERADDAEPFLTSKSFMCVRVCIKINHLPLPDCPTKKNTQSGLEPRRAHYDLWGHARSHASRRRTGAATILWHIWITYCVPMWFFMVARQAGDLFYLS